MERAEFWRLIGAVDRRALGCSDDEVAVQPLIDALAELDEAQIEGFEEQLAQVLYELDGEIYADNAGASGKSGDGFLYARCFVVASGEDAHKRVLENPTTMPRSLDEWCEALLGVAARAWANKTGCDEEEWAFDASVSYETGSNSAKWP